ncbi:MAG: hypothetical protein NVSMB56_11430 [Pyrinomonadaceae bacterium]
MENDSISKSISLFFNARGRLRSGWRFLVFVVLYLLTLILLGGFLALALSRILSALARQTNDAYWQDIAGVLSSEITTLGIALGIGYVCGRVFEDLPFLALGCLPQRGWWRDFMFGVFVGAATLVLATVFAMLGGGLHFNLTFNSTHTFVPVLKTLVGAGFVFVIAAFAEEALFRGYPLQTLLRAFPLEHAVSRQTQISKHTSSGWIALLPTSILFALAHLGNPNAVIGYTFFNTTLAGMWLAVAYARTRTLWFPLGIHFAWNYMQGALLGFPVSGITKIAPVPLVQVNATNAPAWLTGGDYGIEGGLACTVALIVSTIFIWHGRMIRQDKSAVTTND